MNNYFLAIVLIQYISILYSYYILPTYLRSLRPSDVRSLSNRLSSTFPQTRFHAQSPNDDDITPDSKPHIEKELDINDIISSQDMSADMDNFSESLMDESIQQAVKNLANLPKAPEINRLEVLDQLVKEIKSKGYNDKSPKSKGLDAKAMLEALFPIEPSKDPFDEVCMYSPSASQCLQIFYFCLPA
jgi:hypothetical protein